ncbi:MAG: YihY/virulence factor BrkB family protein, partial [Bacteroidales bacterium]|nr:YihY/virulence factor BrkB family protein [Bacteroidales bacterium]
SWGFKVYLANFNRYNLLYGSIGTLLLIMLWLFLNCLVIMLGYELNTAILNGQLKGHKVQHRIHKWSKDRGTKIEK